MAAVDRLLRRSSSGCAQGPPLRVQGRGRLDGLHERSRDVRRSKRTLDRTGRRTAPEKLIKVAVLIEPGENVAQCWY